MLELTEGCRKYDKTEAGGLNMLIHKDTADVITSTQKLIRKCLNCKFFLEKCNKSDQLVDFLVLNDLPHDGELP